MIVGDLEGSFWNVDTRECVSAVEQPALVEALLPRPLYAYLGSHIRIKLKDSHLT